MQHILCMEGPEGTFRSHMVVYCGRALKATRTPLIGSPGAVGIDIWTIGGEDVPAIVV